MNFNILDNILKEIPKEINDIIYNYYRRFCNKCYTSQHYCKGCETYNCVCYNRIICCHCYNLQCMNTCDEYLKICSCCEKYLCILYK